MRLIFSRPSQSTWDKVITDLNGTVIFEQKGLALFPEQIRKDYFDEWESQMKALPNFNIVEVERFV